MKIVALMGSPRKGSNTDLLTDAFLEGALSVGAEVEKITLNNLSVRGCQACYACRKKGACVQKDDMLGLLEKMMGADAWLIATPIYWWGPSAQTKLVLDRLFPLEQKDNKDRVRGKKAFLITASADPVEESTPLLVSVLQKSLAFVGMSLSGQVLVQAHARGEVKDKPDRLERARRLGVEAAGERGGAAI